MLSRGAKGSRRGVRRCEGPGAEVPGFEGWGWFTIRELVRGSAVAAAPGIGARALCLSPRPISADS